MKITLLLVLLVFLLDAAYAPIPAHSRTFAPGVTQRTALIKGYFRQGYAYKDIILFLATMHGIKIGVARLRQILATLGLRRRVEMDENRIRDVLEGVRKELEESGELL